MQGGAGTLTEKEIKHRGDMAKGLQEAYDDERTDERDIDLEAARIVIFSDQHKGTRDGADDFRGCERAYNAALGYYLEAGYTLVALGDVEELWECRPTPVIRSYRNTLALEAEFHRHGRYLRLWGNHDDLWGFESGAAKHLHPIYGEDLKVHEALKLNARLAGKKIGQIFLVHGHQGTTFSQRYTTVSRIVVRYIWRPLQRLTRLPSTTPAKDFQLRAQHDVAMYQWAESKHGLVLIAGHTHRPVFGSRTHLGKIEETLMGLRAKTHPTPDDLKRIVEVRAELEFVKAAEYQGGDTSVEMSKPCYFNTGCCSFGDGDITGMEIISGLIKLVRWPNDEGRPLPETLAEADLQTIFDALTLDS